MKKSRFLRLAFMLAFVAVSISGEEWAKRWKNYTKPPMVIDSNF